MPELQKKSLEAEHRVRMNKHITDPERYSALPAPRSFIGHLRPLGTACHHRRPSPVGKSKLSEAMGCRQDKQGCEPMEWTAVDHGRDGVPR
jgi:hypothetical protein